MVVIIRKNEDDKVKKFFINDSLAELLRGFKKAVTKHNTSVVMVVDGRSGMGKTTLANQIGIALDKNYGLSKIHYSPMSFLEGNADKIGLANSKVGDFILFDEAMLISSRSALSQINKMVIQAMSMIRSKRIYVCFCVNSIFDLERNLALSRADVLLHVYGQTLINRGRFAGFFKGRDGRDRLKELYLSGKKWYSYSKPPANMTGTFPSEFVVDEERYEAQKQVGVNAFLRGVEGKTAKRALEQRNLLIRHLINDKKWKPKEVIDVIGLNKSQISRILDAPASDAPLQVV